jgi:GWxTD domain-containing protein
MLKDLSQPKKGSTYKFRTTSFPLALCFLLLSSSFIVFFSSSCRLYNLERKLDPANAEFLSKVRYIITRKERKIFLELPDSEKEQFIKEFWERRDPDPDTEENEFKMEYFNRIERATELFMGEAWPGWITDRGKIYVLFGPPTERIRYPMAVDRYSGCREICYYGAFPVVFVDSSCTGIYSLVTYDLTDIRELNLMYMQELSKAQDTFSKENRFFDFRWRVKKEIVEDNRVEGTITIEMPYGDIWYKSEGDMLKTVLDVHLELKDFEGSLIWEHEEAFEIAIKEAELKDKQNKMYEIEIPLILEHNLEKLRQGKNLLHALIINRTGGEELKKVMEFRL